MKHNLGVTLLIMAFFLAAQIIGLLAVGSYINISSKSGEQAKPLPAQIEMPNTNALETIIMIVIGILIGTAAAFLIIRSKKTFIWNIWFSIAVFMLSWITLSAFFSNIISIVIAVIFALLKSTKRKMSWVLRNIPELFLYAGFAILFARPLPVWAAAVLLVLISIYDAIAVWKSKHMVSLAKFQLSSGSFAGLNIDYSPSDGEDGVVERKKDLAAKTTGRKVALTHVSPKKAGKKSAEKRYSDEDVKSELGSRPPARKNAILGGGDIAFPMLFAAAVLIRLGWIPAIISIIGASIALFSLLAFSKKDTFYPAMPFLTAGTFIGFGIGMLVLIL